MSTAQLGIVLATLFVVWLNVIDLRRIHKRLERLEAREKRDV